MDGVREVVGRVEVEEQVTVGHEMTTELLRLGMGMKGRAPEFSNSDGVDGGHISEEVTVGAVGGDILWEEVIREALENGLGVGDPRAIDLQ